MSGCGTCRQRVSGSDRVRGKYAKPLSRGSNIVLLDPDVSAAFRTSAAVNRALRKQRKPGRARRAG
jgi:hypothetical protein